MDLTQIFGSTHAVTWWQECSRTIVVFSYGLAVVRLAGRRVFGKWSALDFIVSIIVGSSLSRAITGSAALGGTLASTTLIMLLHWVLAHAAACSAKLSKIIEGAPLPLAREGQADRAAFLRGSISRRDLEEALRQSGVEHIGDTRLIVLEPSGQITVLKKGQQHSRAG
ncbi:MAG TPA: YetF domain-containing protein [Acetobacteraceae bacterium]|jgi:uncharacterized membrane protein YcaP (DUF421 family)|nr:YetF domain-containing protein [Acetobacteraceae bacterium]